MRIMILIALGLSLSGCGALTSLSNPVPLSVALATTERDLRATSPVALSDLGTSRESNIVGAIQAAQCIPPTNPNPLIPVVTGPISLALQGSIQEQAGATVSATPGLAFQVSAAKQQQVTVPITFVSASGLPDFYMGQQLSNLANLDSGSNDKSANGITVSSAKTQLVADILARRQALQVLVAKAESDFPQTVKGCTPDKYGNYSPPVFPQLAK